MGERTSNEMGNLSLKTNNRLPRDFLDRFMMGTSDSGAQRRSDSDAGSGSGSGEEVELNLGLSLGGRFGVDKSKLVKSSSIAAILPAVRGDEFSGGGNTGSGGSYSGLARTSSLPVETEDDWRKRKELQSLRRLAAKRRRSEKQRNLTRGEREEYVAAMGRVGSSVGPAFGSGNWVSGGASPETAAGGGGGLVQPSSQGSAESQAGSCSSISEFESRHLQGSNSGGEASPVSMQSVQERSSQDTTTVSSAGPSRVKTEDPSNNRSIKIGSNLMEMPSVFTQGGGPNGKKIEGILYKYGKGEEVKIMCVCHGSFLSPAEFVAHAGGTNIGHPLKHIVVNPNSSFL